MSRRQRLSGAPTRLLAAAGALLLVGATVLSAAILSDSELVPDGQLATASCFRARVGAVHSGTVTISGPGTTTATIPAVVPANSFVLHSVSTTGGDAGAGLVAVELADATTVEVTRRTAATGDTTVAYHVVEYDCGVRVQRGVSSGSTATSRDVTIDVTDATRAFTTVSVAPATGTTTPSAAQQVTAALTDATTVTLASGAAPGSDARWAWQVVEFVRDVDVDVEHVTATLASGDTSTTVTLGAAVDPSRTLLLAGVRTASGSLEQAAVTAELTADDQVSLARTASGVGATVELQVVQLLDGTTVQAGELTVGDSGTTATAALPTPLDADRTAVVASGTGWGGAPATGRPDAGADAIGRTLGRFGLDDPSTVRVTRGRSDGTTTWTYRAVTWGGPSWWDLAWGYRERIEVDTTTAAAPDGYTLPLSFDHAAAVTDGGALASGDDVRVLRWDGSGWTELDRVLDEGSTWNAADTTIWFRTAAPIDPDTTDASYWLYRGNPAAAAPPADADQVWLVDEDFESGLGAFSQRTTGDAWYAADDWSYRRTVTVPAGSVGSDLTDVPVLVRLTDASMVGQVQDDGADLRFTAADGSTPLPHEVESWDPTTGELVAWVELPTVTAAGDTTAYLYWGATDAPDQQDVVATWSAGFDGVWHLAEDPTGDLPHADDSSPEGRDGVLTGATGSTSSTAAVVGDGVALAADSGRLALGTVDAVGGPLTLSGWVRADSSSGGTVLRLEDGGAEHAGVSLVDDGAGALELRVALRDSSGSLHELTGGTVAVGDTAHVAMTWDGTTLTAWLDGTAVGTTVVTSRAVAADLDVAIGAGPGAGAAPLDGVVDEVRMESVARSADRLTARVANQSTPATFATVGPATSGSWFDQGSWSARTPVTVDAGVVDTAGAGEDLVDFPLLVSFTDATVGASATADGRDLVFTADDGTTRLDHEVESWDAATGELVAWVRIPTLSAAVDTGLFLYHGNASAVDQQDPAGVFRAEYTAVHHLDDDPEEVGP